MAGDTARAVTFFHELWQFTDRFARLEFGEPLQVSHGGGLQTWRGAVLHYTADQDLLRVLRWFRNPESRVSAHLVVCDRKLGIHDEIAKGLPLVRALPVTVIQCRDPGHSAWHSRWANDTCYGIELVSAGMLRKNSEGALCTWRPRDRQSGIWTEPWASSYKEPVKLCGQYWEPFTPGQIRTTIETLRHLRNFGPQFARLEPAWILGHEQVQHEKWDPGPTFPIHGVRSAVFSADPYRDQEWWTRYETDPLDGQAWRDLAVARVVREQATSAETSRDPSVDVAWSRAWAAWSRLAEQPSHSQPRWLKLGLYVLGYAVTGYGDGDFSSQELGDLDQESIRIFQRMAACAVDGIAGPQTCTALVERLWERVGLGNGKAMA